MSPLLSCVKCRATGHGEISVLIRSGWREIKGGHLCPECSSIPEEVTPEVTVRNEFLADYCTECKGPCQGH